MNAFNLKMSNLQPVVDYLKSKNIYHNVGLNSYKSSDYTDLAIHHFHYDNDYCVIHVDMSGKKFNKLLRSLNLDIDDIRSKI